MPGMEASSDALAEERRRAAEAGVDGFGRPIQKRTPQPLVVDFVYFILAEEVNRVKIGYTCDVRRRLKELQSWSPVELSVLKVIKGTCREEERFQQMFDAERVRGEWFTYSERLQDFIRDLPAEWYPT